MRQAQVADSRAISAMAKTLGPEIAKRAELLMDVLKLVDDTKQRRRASRSLRDLIGLLHIEEQAKET